LAIAAGILPAIGPVIAGGLLAAIAVTAAGGAAAGALVGTLVGLGISDEEAAYYDAEFRKGHTILVVQPGDRAQLVQTIMTAHNVENRQMVTQGTLAQQIAERHA
jgi:outer membrane lipoprotein SlyB